MQQPRTFPSKRIKPIRLSFTTWLSSTNQDPIIIQAYNPSDHNAFQLNIFPFTNLHPRDHTFLPQLLLFKFSTIIMVRFIFFLLYHTLFNTHINTTTPTPRFITLAPPPPLSHSPDLGCVGARSIMLLGRFLV